MCVVLYLSCACAHVFLSRLAVGDATLAHEHGEHQLRAGSDACKSVSSSGVTANRLARGRFCVCAVFSAPLGCACWEVAISPLAMPGSCPRCVHIFNLERCDLSVSMTVLAGSLPAYRHRLRDMLVPYAHSSLCRVEVRKSFCVATNALGVQSSTPAMDKCCCSALPLPLSYHRGSHSARVFYF